MFVSPDHGVLMQEYQGITVTGKSGAAEPLFKVAMSLRSLFLLQLCSTGAKGFVGLQAPYLILNKPTAVTSPSGKMSSSHAYKLMMHGFAGMQVLSCIGAGDERE